MNAKHNHGQQQVNHLVQMLGEFKGGWQGELARQEGRQKVYACDVGIFLRGRYTAMISPPWIPMLELAKRTGQDRLADFLRRAMYFNQAIHCHLMGEAEDCIVGNERGWWLFDAMDDPRHKDALQLMRLDKEDEERLVHLEKRDTQSLQTWTRFAVIEMQELTDCEAGYSEDGATYQFTATWNGRTKLVMYYDTLLADACHVATQRMTHVQIPGKSTTLVKTVSRDDWYFRLQELGILGGKMPMVQSAFAHALKRLRQNMQAQREKNPCMAMKLRWKGDAITASGAEKMPFSHAEQLKALSLEIANGREIKNCPLQPLIRPDALIDFCLMETRIRSGLPLSVAH